MDYVGTTIIETIIKVSTFGIILELGRGITETESSKVISRLMDTNTRIVGDVAISGYVHAYERTAPLVNGTVAVGGMAHMTVGHAAMPLDPNWITPLPVWSQYRAVEYGWGRFHIYSNTHAHWTMRIFPNKITDDHWIIKGK